MDGVAGTHQAHIQLFAADERSPIRWRLLSGNNRELGRGIDEHDDRESCSLNIKHLQACADDLEPAVQRMSASTWAWRLLLDGAEVAASCRRYDRLIRCRQGLAHFVDELGDCSISSTVTFTSSRRWGALPAALSLHQEACIDGHDD